MADTPHKETTLSPVSQEFILHWGEMGTRWGINRTVAQIHALLYITREPLNAEQISNTLSVARSNVSTSLRELQGWGIVHTVQRLGDRCEYYTSTADVWEMFRTIARERKRREMDPTIEVIQRCVAQANKSGKEDEHLVSRLSAMLEFFDTATKAYDSIEKVPTSTLVKAARMGDRIWKLLGFK